ncbi:TetR/AcrR family transcriptional regulator [Sphingobacterium paludis]|uniref:TetR family transcriptional regulator n=1 Tax=Sphingobacterium paludis TaxID=1476465 RepID=A0A4R7DBP8_9SPHI|nr:TetR/AcrR family transcriptional regulator [Sphingobacterium paludis]TDS17595.1 TetR family transcriptional regulator [Sphingobacterium paludis]
MDNKKEQIVQAALKRFAHYGFNKTTMSEIAVDLSITKANLYYYYPDKNALIKDVLIYISEDILRNQYSIIDGYQMNLLDVLNALLETRASFLRDYYVLHISENLEWIKGQGVGTVLEALHGKDIEMMTVLFKKAMDQGEVALDDVQQDAACYIEVIKGLSLIRSVSDVLSGMPNAYNVDEILESQKRATAFIFENKLISKN